MGGSSIPSPIRDIKLPTLCNYLGFMEFLLQWFFFFFWEQTQNKCKLSHEITEANQEKGRFGSAERLTGLVRVLGTSLTLCGLQLTLGKLLHLLGPWFFLLLKPGSSEITKAMKLWSLQCHVFPLASFFKSTVVFMEVSRITKGKYSPPTSYIKKEDRS